MKRRQGFFNVDQHVSYFVGRCGHSGSVAQRRKPFVEIGDQSPQLAPTICELESLTAGLSLHQREPVAAVCSDAQPAGIGHVAPAGPLSACGYCDLLASHPVGPAVPPAAPSVLVLVVLLAATILSTRFIPLGAFPSARPRAPPAIS